MSFIVRKTKYRAWPVTVSRLDCDENTGAVTEIKSTFVAHFTAFDEGEFAAIADEAEKKFAPPKPAQDGAQGEGVAAPVKLDDGMPWATLLQRNAWIFCRLIVGWGDEVKNADGSTLAYSPETLSALVTGPEGMAVSTGLHQALREIRFGIAPEKNSNASPVPGEDSATAGAQTSLPTTSLSSE